MIPYIVLVSLTLFLSILGGCSRSELIKKISVNSIFVLLALFSAVRLNIGRDYSSYVDIFNDPTSYAALATEWIWRKINFLLHQCNLTVTHWFILTSIFVNYFIFKSIKKYSSMPFLSICLYLSFFFYFESMNIVRQYVAMSLLLVGYPCLLRKKYLRFLISGLLATIFHYSALFYLVLLPLLVRKYSFKILLTAILTTFIIGTKIMDYVLDKIYSIIASFSSYSSYIDNMYTAESDLGLYKYFLNIVVILTLVLFKIGEDKSTKTRFFVNNAVFGLLIYNCCLHFEVALRFMWYPFIWILFLIPEVLRGYTLKIRLSVISFILLVSMLFMFKNLSSIYYNPYLMI